MIRWFWILILAMLLMGCTQPQTPPPCDEPVTKTDGRVGENGMSYRVLLPPCYEGDSAELYPLLIWTVGDQGIINTATDLLETDSMTPFILVALNNQAGTYYDEEIITDLLPHLEATYRLKTDRQYRAVGGFSFGGGMAARLAWRNADVIGAGITVSGGILESETEKYDEWIFSAEQHPSILIDIGTQDSIAFLTDAYRGVLDTHNVEYTYTTAEGGHDFSYISQNAASYLEWLAQQWQ